MIQQQSLDGNGFALFSDNMTMRFRLGRAVNPIDSLIFKPEESVIHDHREVAGRLWLRDMYGLAIERVVFLMLNPSVANAFKPDNTVARCIEFARIWGARIVEVVNLFALVSTDPAELLKHERWRRGDDVSNDQAILAACQGASRVIAAWGNDGGIGDRDIEVRKLLAERQIKLETFRLTKHGYPTHPLARGKHFIPYDTIPVMWPYESTT